MAVNTFGITPQIP